MSAWKNLYIWEDKWPNSFFICFCFITKDKGQEGKRLLILRLPLKKRFSVFENNQRIQCIFTSYPICIFIVLDYEKSLNKHGNKVIFMKELNLI
jgi:hypothetical protein